MEEAAAWLGINGAKAYLTCQSKVHGVGRLPSQGLGHLGP